MKVRFTWLIFMCVTCFLLEDVALVHFSFSECFPDKPQKCDKDSLTTNWSSTKIRFLLFTRKAAKEPEILHLCNGTLPKNSRFDPKIPFVVIIPGFQSGGCRVESMVELKDELLEKADLNILLISDSDEYGNEFFTAMEKTEKIANVTVEVLRNIQAKIGFRNENLYLIGHSLGAHVAGLIGQQLLVHRITALDPAGVTYKKDTPIEKRLDPNDADLVDVIHTNGGTGLPYFGAYFPIGDADIYINGGADQPFCADTAWNAVKHFNILYGIEVSSVPTLCAHMQAIQYYKMTINNPRGKLIAYVCSSYKKFKTGNCTWDGAFNVTVGYDIDKSFTKEQRSQAFPRKYYVDTKKAWLFD